MSLERVKTYIDEYGMLPPGTRVLCACSGGADSTALLHLLCGMEGVTVLCAHFNHCLRGAESDRDEQFVKSLCETLDVPFCRGSADVAAYAAENRLGTEEAARKLRYAFLEHTAAETACTRIATAHNADDNAETVLMNLARGAGLRGLCGIPPVRGAVIRPLLCVTRAEIETYLAENGLSHVEDSSNESDAFARNRIRRRVLPVLREQNSAAVENILAATELLRADEEYLSSLAENFIDENLCGNTLSATALRALPEPVAVRVLRQMCGSLSRGHVRAVLALCESGDAHAAADVPGMRVERQRDRLRFGASAQPTPMPQRFFGPGDSVALPEIGRTLRCTAMDAGEEIHNSFNTFCFKSGNICGRMYAASRREGESVRLKGRGCTKTLKKLFSEAGLSPAERTAVPVISDEAGVLAVCGFGIAERAAAQTGEPFLKVEII